MKTLIVGLVAAATALTLGLSEADARRLGGGASLGKQAPPVQRQAMPPQRQAVPPQQAPQPGAQAAQPGAQAAQPAAAARSAAPAAGAQAAGGSRWMAPLAGLAAGLGLAALASYLGFGETLATIMLIVLMAVAALVVVRLLLARRQGGPTPAYQGAGREGAATLRTQTPAWQPQAADAGFRPEVPMPRPTGATEMPADIGLQSQVPAGFDVEGFLRNAKVYFIRLQAAFDAADLNDLREFTSPQMFAELKMQIDERRGAANVTEVVALDAELLGVHSSEHEHLASVRFTGLIREAAGATAQPFDEAWNFTRPAHGGGGWVLAGIQQLESAGGGASA